MKKNILGIYFLYLAMKFYSYIYIIALIVISYIFYYSYVIAVTIYVLLILRGDVFFLYIRDVRVSFVECLLFGFNQQNSSAFVSPQDQNQNHLKKQSEESLTWQICGIASSVLLSIRVVNKKTGMTTPAADCYYVSNC